MPSVGDVPLIQQSVKPAGTASDLQETGRHDVSCAGRRRGSAWHRGVAARRLNFSNSRGGTLSPPVFAGFKRGRGEFYGQEFLNGRATVVRFIITPITADSIRFEQAFSDDGGRTWEDNWVAVDTRLKGTRAPSHRAAGPPTASGRLAAAAPGSSGSVMRPTPWLPTPEECCADEAQWAPQR